MAADLSDFYNYVNGGNYQGSMPSGVTIASDGGNNNGAFLGNEYSTPENQQALLSRIQQYDPNARISDYTQQIGGDDARSVTSPFLYFDQSKLPRPTAPNGQAVPNYTSPTSNMVRTNQYNPKTNDGMAFNAGGWNTFAPVAGNGGLSNLHNQGQVWNSGPYGQMTMPQNVKQQNPGLWGVAANLAMAAGNMATGGLMTPIMLARDYSTTGRINPMTAASAVLPYAGQFLSGAGSAINMARQGMGLMNLYNTANRMSSGSGSTSSPSQNQMSMPQFNSAQQAVIQRLLASKGGG